MSNTNLKVHFSSDKQDWETPHSLFNKLNTEFGPFDLDVCASKENAKVSRFYTIEDDGLNSPWFGVCWMNPPYAKGEQEKWLKKAYEESLKGCTVVCLIPSRTDTKMWHDYVMKASEIRFIKGRLKFGNATNSAPFPSAIVIFKPGNNTPVIKSYFK